VGSPVLSQSISAANVPLEKSGIDWTVCRTVEQLEPLAREVADQSVFGWDVETSGRSPWAGRRIIGHSFAWRRPNGQLAAFYAPCRHRSCGMSLFDDLTQIEPETLSEMLRPALEGPAVKRGHNISFDIQFAETDGINVAPPVFDTMLAYRVYNENLRSYRLGQCLLYTEVPHQHGWKNSVEDELKRVARFLKMKISVLKDQHGHEYVPIDIEGRYGCQDAAYEFMLGDFLEARNFWPETTQLEMDLLWCCLDIEKIGVPLDTGALEELREFCRQEMQDLSPQIWTLAGEEFKITNDNDLRRILFSKLNYPVIKETKGGARGNKQPSVDDDSLWALETRHGCQLAALVRRYNSHDKIYSTYSTSIVDLTDAHDILHGEVRQFGARTGRVAMARPNLQNIPTRTPLGRKVKAAFRARQGMIRYCLDYSQLELRVLAHLSQDPTLLRIYREGLDAHKTTAIEAFGTAEKINGVDMRRVAKILNFGVSFGMTEVGLMGNINKDLPEGMPPITEEQAKEFLTSFYRQYSGVVRYRDRLFYDIRNQGCQFANMFGRPRRLPALNHKSNTVRRRAERQAISTMVQGSAAGLVKRCMLATWQYLQAQTHCEAYMVLMVHDDLQFDMAPDGSARTVREVHRIMESTCQNKFSVPIKSDVEWFTTNWNEKKGMTL